MMSDASLEITRDELARLLTGDENVILLDVLPHSYFRHSHLPGALNLPVEEIALHVTQVVPDRQSLVVVYCQNSSCPAAERSIHILGNLGYQNLREYKGGKDDWRAAGLPLEGESQILKRLLS